MRIDLDRYDGADLATALANTVGEVWPRSGDQLTTLVELGGLLGDHGLAEDPVDADLAPVRELRDELRRLLVGPCDDLVPALHRLTGRVPHRVELVDDGGPARWVVRPLEDDLASGLSLVCGFGLLGLVRVLGIERVRDCAADRCRGAFADTSRNGRRRFCMPALCGNRTNVARHRARLRSG